MALETAANHREAEAPEVAELLASVHALQDARAYEHIDHRQVPISSQWLLSVYRAQGTAPVLQVLRAWMEADSSEGTVASLHYSLTAAELFESSRLPDHLVLQLMSKLARDEVCRALSSSSRCRTEDTTSRVVAALTVSKAQNKMFVFEQFWSEETI